MKKADIVILDSGVSYSHTVFNGLNVGGYTLYFDQEQNTLEKEDSLSDDIGHGTAVYYLINKRCPQATVLNLKLISNDSSISSDGLVAALSHIRDNIECKIIHMSLGVECCNHLEPLQQVCSDLVKKNVIIIAAFSNLGCISYPAAFDCVIGVDEMIGKSRAFDYEYIQDSIVNIRMPSHFQMLPWVNGSYCKVAGTSFSSPYITALVYHFIQDKMYSLEDVLQYLRARASSVASCQKSHLPEGCFSIKNAIAFPFNKEIHSLIRFHKDLPFKLMDVYDIKALGHVGKNASDLLALESSQEYIIKNIDTLCWDDCFDTVILGHTNEINEALGYNIASRIIEKCNQYGKNAYCFDKQPTLEAHGIEAFCPEIREEHVPRELLGKLYSIATPVLCVVGTSAKQGKFTLQNNLKRLFASDGYKVGALGTEPSSLLFGDNAIYPVGYGKTVSIRGSDHIRILNKLLHQIDVSGVDIIITGTQSQTVAASVTNMDYIPNDQTYILYGINADGYVLVCNYYDEFEYISRTIQHVESINGTKVIAVAVFPMEENYEWSIPGTHRKAVPEDLLWERVKSIAVYTGKPTFGLVDSSLPLIYEACLEYFQS